MEQAKKKNSILDHRPHRLPYRPSRCHRRLPGPRLRCSCSSYRRLPPCSSSPPLPCPLRSSWSKPCASNPDERRCRRRPTPAQLPTRISSVFALYREWCRPCCREASCLASPKRRLRRPSETSRRRLSVFAWRGCALIRGDRAFLLWMSGGAVPLASVLRPAALEFDGIVSR